MIIGCFGDVIFETSSKRILTPRDSKRDATSRWNNHEVIASKPISEFVGPALDQFSCSIDLNSKYGIDVKKEMDKLLNYCRRGEAFPLIVGVPIGVDKWKITSIGQSFDIMDANGNIIKATVDVVFEEYITTAWK